MVVVLRIGDMGSGENSGFTALFITHSTWRPGKGVAGFPSLANLYKVLPGRWRAWQGRPGPQGSDGGGGGLGVEAARAPGGPGVKMAYGTLRSSWSWGRVEGGSAPAGGPRKLGCAQLVAVSAG